MLFHAFKTIYAALSVTSAVPVQKQADCVASGIAACSFFENCLSKQLDIRHCTSVGPQQYTHQV